MVPKFRSWESFSPHFYGSFNNPVDKIRVGGGRQMSMMSVWTKEKVGKNVQICPFKGGRGLKMVKILSTWLLNDPLDNTTDGTTSDY